VPAPPILSEWFVQPQPATTYHVESTDRGETDLHQRFSAAQLDILEKLNRADRDHLGRLRELIVPDRWLLDELAYSVMPARYAWSASYPRMLLVYVPGQMFGAYAFGALVRWGPVSSGRRGSPTAAGLFHLNWRSVGHTSTIDPDWFMPWYFNFENRQGLSFHQYSLPGQPASHGCVRLLERDARWLFEWGEEWTLDAGGTRVLTPGTPVFIIGRYDFTAPPPWRSPEWLAQPIELPQLPVV
jgi:hypothetical protein